MQRVESNMMISESASYQALVASGSGTDPISKGPAVGAVQFTNRIQEKDEDAYSGASDSLSDETDF